MRSRLLRIGARGRRRWVEERIVWILGSPRSGSTWLMRLLADLTGGAPVNEPLIGAHLALPAGAVSGRLAPDDPLVLDANAGRAAYFFAADAAAVWRPALRNLVLDRLAMYADRDDQLIVVKEPNGSMAAPVLLQTLPRSRLVFLVRDGRDVVDSVLDGASGGWLTDQYGLSVEGDDVRREFLEARAHHWVRSVEAVERAHDAHDPARRLRVGYEELRASTATELERLLRWLGRDDAVDDVGPIVDRLSFESLPDELKGEGRFARTATPGLWRERFSADEQAALERIMGPALTRLGYR